MRVADSLGWYASLELSLVIRVSPEPARKAPPYRHISAYIMQEEYRVEGSRSCYVMQAVSYIDFTTTVYQVTFIYVYIYLYMLHTVGLLGILHIYRLHSFVLVLRSSTNASCCERCSRCSHYVLSSVHVNELRTRKKRMLLRKQPGTPLPPPGHV